MGSPAKNNQPISNTKRIHPRMGLAKFFFKEYLGLDSNSE
jgi:hypothetical protein